jgi:rhodanese-related sulfurtransferase
MKELTAFILNHWLLVLALVVVLTMIAMNMGKTSLLGFKEVDPREAVQLINHEAAQVLDTRDDGEFRAGHILNAIHIPVAELDARAGELETYRDVPIVVYCKTGQRSARASTILKNKGFNSIYKLKGGVLAWQGTQLPLTKDL